MRAKQTKVCDAERAGFYTPTHVSNVSCYSKDRVRAVIEAKRVHCTQPYGFACQPLRGLVTTPAKPGSYQLPSDRRITNCSGSDCLQHSFPDGKPGRGFLRPSINYSSKWKLNLTPNFFGITSALLTSMLESR